MSPGSDRPVGRVLELLEGVRVNGKGYVALCPARDDARPSLSVEEGDNGRALLHCFAGCGTSEIVAALGLEMTDLFAWPQQCGGRGICHPPEIGRNRATLHP